MPKTITQEMLAAEGISLFASLGCYDPAQLTGILSAMQDGASTTVVYFSEERAKEFMRCARERTEKQREKMEHIRRWDPLIQEKR